MITDQLNSSVSSDGLIEHLAVHDTPLAIILRASFSGKGIQFFTPSSYSQQLGYMNRPKGYLIKPHMHRPITREVHYTNEVLFIKRGKVIANFYSKSKDFVGQRLLNAGDIILLIEGGHGFEMIEDSEIIEVKQGPYANEMDKERI